MEFVLFIVVAIGLYFISDWLLRKAESHVGRQFEHRSIIFFFILFAAAVIAFNAIDWLLAD